MPDTDTEDTGHSHLGRHLHAIGVTTNCNALSNSCLEIEFSIVFVMHFTACLAVFTSLQYSLKSFAFSLAISFA